MQTLRTLAVVGCSLFAACATTTHPRGTADAAAPARSFESRAEVQRCRDLAVLASIEVYPVGLNPQRRFEVIGTVETGPEGSAMERVATLQAEACALGANAVIGWSEEGLGRGLATAFRDGATILSVRDGRPVVASGLAIVYTDRAVARADEASDPASLWDPTTDL